MALVTRQEVLDWVGGTFTDLNTTVLDECIDGADAAIRRETGAAFEKTQYTLYFDGDRADGRSQELLRIPSKYQPVIHSGGELVTVTENGKVLTVGIGFATADVIVKGANVETAARLIRLPRSPAAVLAPWAFANRWAPGVQNIVVTLFAGYTAGSLPEDIRRVCCEWAWLIFNSARSVGTSSTSRGPAATVKSNDLSPWAQRVLERWRRRAA